MPQPFYLNFRRLALSTYLLSHPKLRNTVVESIRIDLRSFLKEYEWCYGSENLVYDVRLLQHFPNDVREHGPLDSFSAFPFESYMDTGLQQKETRDRFMPMLTRLMDNDPKTSMRYVLSYPMTPEVASSFTPLGTSSKRALQKCRFYDCI
ncbi:unnamed protein product [Schistosoma curassoni]|uniref:Uncharacterized protein n=1 Tax=Schistosoma curassoni TaxID=6186 RepID=A0A3P8BG95_9TREM|nr:unnamed protein product [Schistosoma curassoni]